MQKLYLEIILRRIRVLHHGYEVMLLLCGLLGCCYRPLYHRDAGVEGVANVPHDDAHFSVYLPSDLIAEVMEGHFNRSMFKKRVRVVDLRMEQDMCMFSLAWIDTPKVEGTETDLEFAQRLGVPVVESGVPASSSLFSPALNGRDTKGRYVKKEVSNG